jgi:MFS transporter, DHA3 family, macrolide efflux protein
MCNVLLAMAGVLVIPLVLRSAESPGALGVVMAAGGAGAVIGGLAMALWGGPARLMHGVLGFAIAAATGIALLGAGSSTWAMAAGMLGYWCFLGISNACYTVLIQVKVPHHLHGRIFAMNQVVAFSTMPLGFVLAGPLADRVFEPMMAPGGSLAGTVGQVLGTGPGRGVALLVVLVGTLAALVNTSGYLRPRLRRLEREMADANPDEAIATGTAP